ncbi:alanine racemase [Nocardioides sp. zg-DK7169]|nr:alanine racemase [Nocardioides sp. zg-DK7169]
MPLARAATRSAAPRLLVDPEAVAANTRVLAARVTPGAPGAPGGTALMAVVKADGFGLGAATVARAALAHGATSLGVTTVAEGLALRAEGIDVPVLSWLNGVDADFAGALAAGLDLAVPSTEHLGAITRAASPGRPARVHLHLDTGLARDGAEPSGWATLCRAARTAERAGLVQVVGVMGHLALADEPGHPANAVGRTRFAWGVQVARACGLRPALRHLAATAATLTDPQSHHTLVRVGAGLVGIDPSGTTALRPAVTLSAPVVQVRRVRAGTPVGYGHTWTAARATTLALLPVGYADGLPRAASGRASVLLRGQRRPVVGRVSMDQVVLDLGDDAVALGDTATVLGPGDAGEPTPAEWATWSGTLPHEVLTGFGPRPDRVVATTVLRSVR